MKHDEVVECGQRTLVRWRRFSKPSPDGGAKHSATPKQLQQQNNSTTTPPRRTTHNSMADLDQILQRVSNTSNSEERLDELRYTILTQGIPANNEGMVSRAPHTSYTLVFHV